MPILNVPNLAVPLAHFGLRSEPVFYLDQTHFIDRGILT